jgi:pyridoxine 5-phosphate synthase
MISLSVNVNKIATLRNSRGGDIPNLIQYTEVILNSGVQGITVHPRSDQRHITKKDTYELKDFIDKYNQKNNKKIEYNIEGAPEKRFQEIVLDLKPDQATLVPVKEGEITSDHGFDFKQENKNLLQMIESFQKEKIRVSLFLEPIGEQIPLAKKYGADRIEFYTGPFAFEFENGRGDESFQKYKESALIAIESGLEINAGHDLDDENLVLFRNLPSLKEVSIGHRLLSSSLLYGLENTIKKYLSVLK